MFILPYVMSSYKRHFLQGFTILELLIVIGIIGILSSVILISYKGYTDKARLSNTMQWAKSMHSELGVYAGGGWSFDSITGDTVLDDSGNGNNGTRYGAIQIDGVLDKALSFDGINDYVEVANRASWDPSTNSNFTVSLWYNRSGTGSGANETLIEHSLGIQGGFWINAVPAGQRVVFFVTGTPQTVYFNQQAIPNDIWTHIAFSYNASTKLLTVYKNGVYQNSGTMALGYARNTSVLRFGMTNNNFHFNGKIDDVRIYKEALTQAQIQQHYAEGVKTHQNIAKLGPLGFLRIPNE